MDAYNSDICQRCGCYNNDSVVCNECYAEVVNKIFSDMYDLLTQIVEANDGDTVWYNGGTTAHEALINLAEKYDPGIAKTLEVRLERDCGQVQPVE